MTIQLTFLMVDNTTQGQGKRCELTGSKFGGVLLTLTSFELLAVCFDDGTQQ